MGASALLPLPTRGGITLLHWLIEGDVQPFLGGVGESPESHPSLRVPLSLISPLTASAGVLTLGYFATDVNSTSLKRAHSAHFSEGKTPSPIEHRHLAGSGQRALYAPNFIITTNPTSNNN